MQATLQSPIRFAGVGLHGGRPANVIIHPAPRDAGITFVRTDLGGLRIPARADLVARSPLCTRLVGPTKDAIGTIEHLMAALAGCDVTNARVELDGAEVPILDGSALPYVRAIRAAGLSHQEAPGKVLVIKKHVRVCLGDAWAEARPWHGFRLKGRISFEDAAIGTQSLIYRDGPTAFERLLAPARTFCRRADVEAMRAAGLARGGSTDNAIVVDGAEILTPGGLRMEREFIRHKLLDMIGDLALVGAPIRGQIEAFRPGHALNNLMARALLETPGVASLEVEAPAAVAA